MDLVAVHRVDLTEKVLQDIQAEKAVTQAPTHTRVQVVVAEEPR